MQDITVKQKMLEMWFKRVYDHINLLEWKIRGMNVTDASKNNYQALIDELETQFENIKIVRKVLKNDAYLQGYNHRDLEK